MTDLLSNFMAVFDNEVEAYWCFNNYMENVQHWYTVEGIKERPHLVKSLLRDLEPNLHRLVQLFKHYDNIKVYFCLRKLLDKKSTFYVSIFLSFC